AGWMTTTCWHWILKLQASFLSGHYEAAVAAAEKAKSLIWASVGCIQLLDYHYYAALSIAAVFERAAGDGLSELREGLYGHLKQLHDWGEHCSLTFKDRYTLVAAEVARIEGRDLDAMHLYEETIELARMTGFVQNVAIAYEIAGRFCLH